MKVISGKVTISFEDYQNCLEIYNYIESKKNLLKEIDLIKEMRNNYTIKRRQSSKKYWELVN